MNKIMIASVAVTMLCGSAFSQEKYDHKIAEAAAMIVAAKIGEIRGGLDIGVEVEFVRGADVEHTSTVASARGDIGHGLARAVDIQQDIRTN